MTDVARSEAAVAACGLAPALFAGRTAVVTGGTSGIGLATAGLLAALVAEVHAAGLGAHPDAPDPGVRFHTLDVTDTSACEALVGALGRLDILVNAAGSPTARASSSPTASPACWM